MPTPRFEHMYTRVITPPTITAAKELTMRINFSDILFALLSSALLLAAAFTLGGLAARPFAG